jgi:hypothetical protein
MATLPPGASTRRISARAAGRIRDVAQSVSDRDRIERSFGEGESEGVALDEAAGASPVARAAPRDREHREGEVGSHDVARAGVFFEKDEITAAAAEVEDPRLRGRAGEGEPHGPPLPPAVQPEADQVVDEVVAPRDPREEIANAGGARTVFGEVPVLH